MWYSRGRWTLISLYCSKASHFFTAEFKLEVIYQISGKEKKIIFLRDLNNGHRISMLINKISQGNMVGVAKGQPVSAKELHFLLFLSERTFISSDQPTASILHIVLMEVYISLEWGNRNENTCFISRNVSF